jgi:hypothetical protein
MPLPSRVSGNSFIVEVGEDVHFYFEIINLLTFNTCGVSAIHPRPKRRGIPHIPVKNYNTLKI